MPAAPEISKTACGIGIAEVVGKFEAKTQGNADGAGGITAEIVENLPGKGEYRISAIQCRKIPRCRVHLIDHRCQ